MSKTEECYVTLKGRIMDGTYGPGHRIVVDQLKRESNASVIPWREAVRRLEAEGWVEVVPHVGAIVKTFDTGAFASSMRIVARLEGLATALSVEHLTAENIDAARAMNRDMEKALGEFDPVRFGRLNRAFHAEIYTRCGDEHLTQLLDAEWARVDLVRRSAYWYAPGRALASVAEHDALLDLLEIRADTEVIETTARRHELNTLEAITSYQERLDSEAV